MTVSLLIDDNARAAVRQVYARSLRPAPRESMAKWADSFRQIAKGPEKGQWRTARTPYLAEPMECMGEGSTVEKVVMQFATQLGKTEVLYNTILQRIHRSPQDMMVVQPTLMDAKQHSRERFMPTVRRMPDVAKQLAKTTSRDASTTWETKSLAGGATLFFAGANSARSLASKPLGLVCCDEIDGYPLDVDGEGDPLTLIGERMSNFSNRKLLLCSTPTLRDFSRIEAEYLASDRRRYWVPCPHCGEFQVLEWGSTTDHGIKWLKTDTGEARPETAVYVCRHHGCTIQEHAKTGMLAEGVWRADVPGAQMGLVAGFHLSKLYSPIGWRSWRWMVAKWVEARAAERAGDTTKLKGFVNTSLAETWEDQGEKADSHALEKRAENYRLGTVPWGGLVVTGASDVQADRIECYAKAWGRGEESWLVDARIFYGDPSVAEGQPGSPWNEVTAWRRQPFAHASGVTMRMRAHGIDTGYLTQDVYAYVRRHAHEKVLALDGRDKRAKAILGKPVDVEINHRGLRLRKGVKLWPVGTYPAKALVYGRLRVTTPGPGYMHFSTDLLGSYYEQLTAERLVTKYVRGHALHEWVKPNGKRNEALDCEVYSVAVAHYLGIPRFVDQQWQALEARLRQVGLFDAAAEEPSLPPSADEQPEEAEPQAAETHAAAPIPLPTKTVQVTLAPEERVSDSAPPEAPPAPTPAPSLSQPAAVRRPIVRGRIQRRTRW